jgi:hypothetical protein
MTGNILKRRKNNYCSHRCGENTSDNLKQFEINNHKFSAVMLDQHGPNIVFHSSIDPNIIIHFINDNFDLSSKTGGPVKL